MDYKELKWNNAPPLDADKKLVPVAAPATDGNAAPPKVMMQQQQLPSQINTSQLPSSLASLPLHADKTALLVVDVQPEYWSQCPAVREDFPHFPAKLLETVELCRQRKINRIIWVRADYRYSHSPWLVQFARIHELQIFQNKTMRDEIPCDPTSADFQWETFATPQGGDIIIPKSSWSSTSNTSLMEVLRLSGVDTVLVCGLITSVCVQHSAFGVFEAGYRTILVTDACADRGMARHQAALALYGDYMYELATTADLKEQMLAAQPLWVTPQTINRVSPLLTPISSMQHVDSVASSMSAMTLGPPAAGTNVNHNQHSYNSSGTSSVSSSYHQQHGVMMPGSPQSNPGMVVSGGGAHNLLPASIVTAMGSGRLIAPRPPIQDPSSNKLQQQSMTMQHTAKPANYQQ